MLMNAFGDFDAAVPVAVSGESAMTRGLSADSWHVSAAPEHVLEGGQGQTAGVVTEIATAAPLLPSTAGAASIKVVSVEADQLEDVDV